ncbi:hypothetical protein Taro_012683 [Colocasia esculenta]|uniref:FHA domain-containing protein n=1 Tax=Colocasia esculenta TaxID=4460 RepID=A0A843U9T0_COLES|nr:hypothetical protein [Colocasia esculenta]
MELEAEDGATRIPIFPGSQKTEVGRGTGLATSDSTISRRHVSFQLAAHPQVRLEGEPAQEADAARVSFEVIGRNPVLVITREGGKQIFRRSERGELGPGDRISLSLKTPCFLSVKSSAGGGVVDKGVLDAVRRREQRTLQRRKEREEAQGKESERADVSRVNVGEEGGGAGEESKLQMLDLSEIDPVKEFGFLVRGHEFDHYTRKIRDIKRWNWFLTEQGDSNDEDEHSDEGSGSGRCERLRMARSDGEQCALFDRERRKRATQVPRGRERRASAAGTVVNKSSRRALWVPRAGERAERGEQVARWRAARWGREGDRKRMRRA